MLMVGAGAGGWRDGVGGVRLAGWDEVRLARWDGAGGMRLAGWDKADGMRLTGWDGATWSWRSGMRLAE